MKMVNTFIKTVVLEFSIERYLHILSLKKNDVNNHQIQSLKLKGGNFTNYAYYKSCQTAFFFKKKYNAFQNRDKLSLK